MSDGLASGLVPGWLGWPAIPGPLRHLFAAQVATLLGSGFPSVGLGLLAYELLSPLTKIGRATRWLSAPIWWVGGGDGAVE